MLSLQNVDLTWPRVANQADQMTSFTATFGNIVYGVALIFRL